MPARLGIDYPRLKAINPRLVYCGLTGYGDIGPLSEKGGFDQVLQCLSGMAVFQGGGADKPQVVLGRRHTGSRPLPRADLRPALSDGILAERVYSAAEIAALRDRGVVK